MFVLWKIASEIVIIAFDDDESCKRLDSFLNDSLHITSKHTFGNLPPMTDDDPPAVSHMHMLAHHREYCVQAVDSLLHMAKLTAEHFCHSQELHSASNAYALGQAQARLDWAAPGGRPLVAQLSGLHLVSRSCHVSRRDTCSNEKLSLIWSVRTDQCFRLYIK